MIVRSVYDWLQQFFLAFVRPIAYGRTIDRIMLQTIACCKPVVNCRKRVASLLQINRYVHRM